LFCFDVLIPRRRKRRSLSACWRTSARAWRNSSPQPPPSATPSLGLPFFSAELEAVFRKAKCAAKEDVALTPTHPYAGNDKELPFVFTKLKIFDIIVIDYRRYIAIILIIVIYYNEVKQQINNCREYKEISEQNECFAGQIIKISRCYL